MPELETRELECFLMLCEELHFGHAAERLRVSQSRVSQLLRSLERRIGARLFERTSRRVRLTPLGERFAADLRPAYDALRRSVEQARIGARGVEGVLRVGFSGFLNERVTAAIGAFRDRHPACEVETVEHPLADPFGGVRRGEVDAAIVPAPVREPDLVAGPPFSKEPQTLVVSGRHPFAGRESVSAEDLADCVLVGIAEPAPRYWRDLQVPAVTPGGRPVARGPEVSTLQEAMSVIAVGRGAMLLCAPTARYHGRPDVAFVPVTGLPDSTLTLVWHRDNETASLRALGHALTA
ncbi:LysR family transcriptional regulator [Streptosporangium saharense]|uniref:LysR family transcriptional regulator n=1 Tax=Streptosporangium saharense TaxID=1706840 RepID=UPI0034121116